MAKVAAAKMLSGAMPHRSISGAELGRDFVRGLVVNTRFFCKFTLPPNKKIYFFRKFTPGKILVLSKIGKLLVLLGG